MVFIGWTHDQDIIDIDTDVGEALEDAVHCTLEQCWCQSNTEWQPGVLEQLLMGVNSLGPKFI